MNRQSTFTLTLIAAALTGIYGQAAATDDADELKQLSKPDSSVSVWIGNVNHNRPQMGKFDGMEEDGTYAGLDADVRRRDDATGTWTTISARNLGLSTREFSVAHERQGSWGVSLDYDRIQSESPLTFMTGVKGIGTTTLKYGTPGATTAAAQAGLYPATNEVHLGTTRDITTLGFYRRLMPDLSLKVTFKNEDKDGTQVWGRGSNPEFAVQPISGTTREAEAVLSYAGQRWQLSGGVSGSWFNNDNSYVDTIGASQTTAAGSSQSLGHTFLSLPLDNKAYRIFLDGGYNFTASTRGTFKASYIHATQDDSLNTLSNALVASGARGSSSVMAGVPSSLDGEVNTTTFELGLTSRPIDKLSVVAKLSYNKKDDQTPEQTFGTGLTNHPYDLEKTTGKLEGTYRLPDGYSLTAGADVERRERDLPRVGGAFEGTVKMRTETTEKTFSLQLRRAMSETVNGSMAYLHSKRDGSSWEGPETEAPVTINNGNPVNGSVYTDVTAITVPWTNPFAWADRTRDKWRLMVDWAPVETVQLQFNYEHSNDDYDVGKSGLENGKAEVISIDANVALSKDWQLNGWLSHDTTKAHQIGITYDPRTTSLSAPSNQGLGKQGWLCSSANANPGNCTTDLIWDANPKDTGRSVGLGIQGSPMTKLKVGANLQWTETKSEYDISSNVPTYKNATNASKQGLPDITNTMTRVALFGQYALQENADLRLDVVYEHWKSDDWTWMVWDDSGKNLVPFTNMDGTRVIADPDQSSVFVGARYIYRFQ